MTKTDAAAERLRGAEGVDWAYDGQSDDLATVLDALDKAQATLDVLTRMDELTIEAQTRRAEAAEADRDTMIERAHGWKARAESAEAERDELRMALTEDAAAIDRTTVVVATAVGDSRLAIGREMVKLGYQWLRERLTTAESERDHYKHAALKLGSDLEKAEAEATDVRVERDQCRYEAAFVDVLRARAESAEAEAAHWKDQAQPVVEGRKLCAEKRAEDAEAERDDCQSTRNANSRVMRALMGELRQRPGWTEPDPAPDGGSSMDFREVILREIRRTEAERDGERARAESSQRLVIAAESKLARIAEAVGPNVIYAPDEGENWGAEEDAYMEGAERALGRIRAILTDDDKENDR